MEPSLETNLSISNITDSWINAKSTNSQTSNLADSLLYTTTATPSIGYGYSYFNDATSLITNYNETILVKYLSESEISELLEKIKPRMDENDFKKIITIYVENRHFSEEFLLKYAIGSVEKYSLMIHHASEINSGEYPSIALMFEAEK